MGKQDNPGVDRDAKASESAANGDLTSGERSLIRRLTEILQFADFMAVLMVAATAFSAFATWRTAEVTSRVFAVEERPFLRVQRVVFEQGDTPSPRAVIEYRNFGRIPASSAVISVRALLNGKRAAEMPDEMPSIMAGMLSPGVPHYFYRYFPPDAYKTIVSGKSNLMLDVRAEYRGPAGAAFCYNERFAIDYRSTDFRPAGGTDRCSGTDIY
jgi:hypothetical protein